MLPNIKMTGNLRIAGVELPLGLIVTTLILGMVAIANLFTKQIATIYGVSFTIVLFIVLTVSEVINKKRVGAQKAGLEEFNLDMRPDVTASVVHARPGCVLVAVRDNRSMTHLLSVLQKTNFAAARYRRNDRSTGVDRSRGIRVIRSAALL
jgi:hypothetical protein